MNTIIVTGGAGFIGSNFIFYMLRKHKDCRIICVDSLTYAGNIETLQPIWNNDKFIFEKIDIRDRDGVFNIVEKYHPDTVVNFAAESHVDRSITNPQLFLETNVIGTSVLLDACRKYDVGRFHQVSTDEVYGDLPLDKPEMLFTEKNPLKTSSPYSASKASADLLTMAYARTYGLPVTISRCSNNYGPYQFPEKLIPLMINKALSNEKLPIYGDGLNVRDWLFVEDHCSAIDSILLKGKIGEVYNVGGNNERSNMIVVKTILQVLDKPEDLITHVEDRKGHDRRYAIDSSKIQKELGWRPTVDFETGIKRTISWYVDNIQWSKRILDGSYLDSNKSVS